MTLLDCSRQPQKEDLPLEVCVFRVGQSAEEAYKLANKPLPLTLGLPSSASSSSRASASTQASASSHPKDFSDPRPHPELEEEEDDGLAYDVDDPIETFDDDSRMLD
jgi:hypothetical protein